MLSNIYPPIILPISRPRYLPEASTNAPKYAIPIGLVPDAKLAAKIPIDVPIMFAPKLPPEIVNNCLCSSMLKL